MLQSKLECSRETEGAAATLLSQRHALAQHRHYTNLARDPYGDAQTQKPSKNMVSYDHQSFSSQNCTTS